MKFPQLQIGQRFVYQDKTYRKATPLMADPEDGTGQRLIPRSAVVEALDAPARPPEIPSEIPLAQVDQAMGELSVRVTQIITESGLDAAGVNQLLGELQLAFIEARHHLKLP